MISGGIACFVHAFLPFLFTHTGSGIIATLHTRMVTSRLRQGRPLPVAEKTNRITAA
jgi:hypothetical protein